MAGDLDFIGEATKRAMELAGPRASATRLAYASALAEAEITLERVRAVRQGVIREHIKGVNFLDAELTTSTRLNEFEEIAEMIEKLRRLDRYDQRAFARLMRALRAFGTLPE